MKRLLAWQIGTVKTVQAETPQVKTFTLSLPAWAPHRAGQHYDLRLTAPDGYQAQRSYSIASEPERAGEVDLTIERLEDGEVSSYMHDVIVPGDQVELRGPIGGYFVWEAGLGGPLLLMAGGSGIVPLMSMIRHRAAARATVPARLLYSVRTPDDVIYFEELMQRRALDDGLEVIYTFTRAQPADWTGYARRIDRPMLEEVAAPYLAPGPSRDGLRVYICGPTLLVELAANGLVEIGVPPGNIRTERFGPTGGSPG